MSTQQELAVTYDVSNDFFRLWLDKRMNYSCALFLDPRDTLEQAQTNKLRWFHDRLQLSPSSRVLDIGCGWGGALEFLARDMRLSDTTGITLSRAQYQELDKKALPGVQVHCVSYEDYEPKEKFDAALSIGMFEHLANSAQTRSGENLPIYRNYFRRVRDWTRPGARFGLQSVISWRIPRERDALREIAWTTEQIFPGAISPRLESIVATAAPYWEVIEIHTRRGHYERTADEWLRRLTAQREAICEQWGEPLFRDYQRYLGACVSAFASGHQSLAQLILQRVD
jgi:cyclopropane-fatty-acyl-phospholipid synthase